MSIDEIRNLLRTNADLVETAAKHELRRHVPIPDDADVSYSSVIDDDGTVVGTASWNGTTLTVSGRDITLTH